MFYICIHNCSFYVFVLDRFTCADPNFFDLTFVSQSSIFQGREFMVLIYCQTLFHTNNFIVSDTLYSFLK